MTDFSHKMTIPPYTGKGPRERVKIFVDPDTRKKIVSLWPNPFTFHDNNGTVRIPGKPADKPYAFAEVRPGWTVVDHGDNRFDKFYDITAEEIARSLVADPAFADMGVFVPEGDNPTEAELDAARTRQRDFLLKQIEIGDGEWKTSQNPRAIPAKCKIACQVLNVKRDWAAGAALAVRTDCPACGESIKPDVAICSHCKAVLDHEKARKYGLVPEPAPAKSVSTR